MNTIHDIMGSARRVLIIQPENPDGDSLGSALALEHIFGEAAITTTMYCPIDIPKYLRYIDGWDRVTDEFPNHFDAAIIVDTSSAALLDKMLSLGYGSILHKKPVLVIDHHASDPDLPFDAELVIRDAISTGEVIYEMCLSDGVEISTSTARYILATMLSDSLGFTTENVTARSMQVVSDLIDKGASIAALEQKRREFSKKDKDILAYKGLLLQRVEYLLDDKLAIIHIPWDEIETYSDRYNPSVLVLDEMRYVENVKVAVALKTYPDGKLTGKIRCNHDAGIGVELAGFFGGGGHKYASGFKIYETLPVVRQELIAQTLKLLESPTT